MSKLDMYELIDGPRFVRTPWCVLNTKEWYKIIGTAGYKVWSRMYRNTIRSPMKNGLGKKIYENYYKKGLICMHWSQEDMASDIGIKSKSHISELIAGMVEKGIVKKHMDKWNNRSVIIYEMGTHDKTVSTNENMHLYTYVVEKEIENSISEVDKFK